MARLSLDMDPFDTRPDLGVGLEGSLLVFCSLLLLLLPYCFLSHTGAYTHLLDSSSPLKERAAALSHFRRQAHKNARWQPPPATDQQELIKFAFYIALRIKEDGGMEKS